MPKPDSSETPAAVEGGRLVPEEIPDDVRAELDAEAKPAAPLVSAEPVPEDVLAELDADARAESIERADPDARPVALDEDSER
jgi:hypothetical protein